MVIAFTGHRKLNEEVARKKLEDYLYNTLFMQVVNKKIKNIQFIMGGALGFDQLATQAHSFRCGLVAWVLIQ